MDFNELIEYLFEDNDVEKEQKVGGYNVNDQNLPFDKVPVPKMPESPFFNEGNIFINKHHRYSEMPAHTHAFVEFNYMLSGSCIQHVNGQKIELQQGELLLMDRETVQCINALGEKDILINILLKENSITSELLMNMVKSNGLVSEFLLNASSKYGNHENFIHFHCSNDINIQDIIKRLLLEYYNKTNYYMRSMNLLLSLLLIDLTREIEEDNIESFKDSKESIITILRYIEANFKTSTLENTANYFGYNSNYLSNKLKKETGYSFKELVNNTRYKVAIALMNETDYSIETISREIGFETTSSLYKLFAKFNDKTPKELQKSMWMNKNK